MDIEGIQFCSKELSERVEKLEEFRMKLYEKPDELTLTESELFDLRVLMRDIAGLSRLLERDITTEVELPKTKCLVKRLMRRA